MPAEVLDGLIQSNLGKNSMKRKDAYKLRYLFAAAAAPFVGECGSSAKTTSISPEKSNSNSNLLLYLPTPSRVFVIDQRLS